MQMLLKLILTYNIYFGCVIYEVLNFPKSCTARAFAINVSNYEYNIGLIIDSNDETKRCSNATLLKKLAILLLVTHTLQNIHIIQISLFLHEYENTIKPRRRIRFFHCFYNKY